MKIIEKYHCNDIINGSLRSIRIIFYSVTLFFIILSGVFLALGLSNVIRDATAIAYLVICLLLAALSLYILQTAKKAQRGLYTEQDKNTYRLSEVEFKDDCISGADFNYYAASSHTVKYESIDKVCFSKKDVNIFAFNSLIIGFSRANMTEAEETALIEFLSQKLPVNKFDAAKIPKRSLARCSERQLIPEKEIINLFRETVVSYKQTRADTEFLLTHNYVSGAKSNLKLRVVIWSVIALAIAGLWIVSLIIAEGWHYSMLMLVFFIALIMLIIPAASLFSIKTIDKALEKIASQEISVTDYFITYRIKYRDGSVASTAYNSAAFLGITEFKDYFLLAPQGNLIAVPKNSLDNLDTLRQIFAKELGPKFRSFPDK